MKLTQISKLQVCCCLFIICYPLDVFADTIYEWTDPWGQVQYSKTPEPGSRVSELTELPEIQETTELQKQEAMLNKMQKIRESFLLHQDKKSTEKFLKQQIKNKKIYCSNLRNMLANTKIRIARSNLISGVYLNQGNSFLTGQHGLHHADIILERDLHQEIRKLCR